MENNILFLSFNRPPRFPSLHKVCIPHRFCRPRLINDLFGQEVQLPDTDTAMVPTPAREPFARPHGPTSKRTYSYYAHRNTRIVQRSCRDWIDGRQVKCYGNEDNPNTRDSSNRFASFTEIKRATFEIGPYQGQGDWDPVGDEETNGGDGCGAEEGGRGAQGG